MKLPQFNNKKSMSLNMSSSMPTVDRSREFQALGEVAGTVNQFTEQLEAKRRAANIETFAHEEKLSTASDWAKTRSVIATATKEDGTFDFNRAKEASVDMGIDPARWDGLQSEMTPNEKQNGEQFYNSDQVVGSWWKSRVQQGAGNANNPDQASAYIAGVKGTSLQETVKSQIAYNVKRSKYHENIKVKSQKEWVKSMGAKNSLIDIGELEKGFKLNEASFMGLRKTHSDEKIKALIDSARHETAITVLTQTQRIINNENQKESPDQEKLKEMARYGISFLHGSIEGSPVGYNYDPTTGATTGKQKATINFSGKETKDTKNVTTYKKEGRTPQSLNIHRIAEDSASKESVEDDIYEIDPSLLEVFNTEIVAEEEKKELVDAPKVKGPTLEVGGSIYDTGKNMFGKILTPPEQQKWLMIFNRIKVSSGVKDMAMGVKNVQDMITEFSKGDMDPLDPDNKVVSGARGILDKILATPDSMYRPGYKAELSKKFSNGIITGSIKKQMGTMSRQEFYKNSQNIDKIVADRREKLIENFPQVAEFMPEGVESIDVRALKKELNTGYQEKMQSIQSNAANYYTQNVQSFADQNAKVLQLFQEGSPEAPKALSTFRANVRKQAARDGKVVGVKTLPPTIANHFVNQLAKSRDVWTDPEGLKATAVIVEIKKALGGDGSDFYSGMSEVAKAAKDYKIPNDTLKEGTKLQDLLHVVAATGDTDTIQKFISYSKQDMAGTNTQLSNKGVTRKEINTEIGKYMEDYKQAMVSSNMLNNMSKGQFNAVSRFIEADVVNEVAWGVQETSWYNVFSKYTASEFQKSGTFSTGNTEKTTVKISRGIFGSVVSEEGNTVLIPKSVMTQRSANGKARYPQMERRTADFLDKVGSPESIKHFMKKINLKPMLEQNGQKTQIYQKYASVMPKRVQRMDEKGKNNWIADRYRADVARTARWRTETDGLALVYLPDPDSRTSFRFVQDNKTKRPLVQSWEAIHNLSPYKNYKFND